MVDFELLLFFWGRRDAAPDVIDKLVSLPWRVVEFLFHILELGVEAFAFELFCFVFEGGTVLEAEGSDLDQEFGFRFFLAFEAGIKNLSRFCVHVLTREVFSNAAIRVVLHR